MRKKIFLTFALLLMAVMGAWAKDFTGGELYTLEEFQYGNRVNLTENNIYCHLRCDNRQRTTDNRQLVHSQWCEIGRRAN